MESYPKGQKHIILKQLSPAFLRPNGYQHHAKPRNCEKTKNFRISTFTQKNPMTINSMVMEQTVVLLLCTAVANDVPLHQQQVLVEM